MRNPGSTPGSDVSKRPPARSPVRLSVQTLGEREGIPKATQREERRMPSFRGGKSRGDFG